MMIEPDEIEARLLPILKENGSEIPERGCSIAAVEFDEQGKVVAYQMMQNMIFLEGLWSRDNSSHLLTLYRMACKYALTELKQKSVMTMCRQDSTGGRISRLAQALGMKNQNWNVFRRKF